MHNESSQLFPAYCRPFFSFFSSCAYEMLSWSKLKGKTKAKFRSTEDKNGEAAESSISLVSPHSTPQPSLADPCITLQTPFVPLLGS
jgi:hypothetical protein